MAGARGGGGREGGRDGKGLTVRVVGGWLGAGNTAEGCSGSIVRCDAAAQRCPLQHSAAHKYTSAQVHVRYLLGERAMGESEDADSEVEPKTSDDEYSSNGTLLLLLSANTFRSCQSQAARQGAKGRSGGRGGRHELVSTRSCGGGVLSGTGTVYRYCAVRRPRARHHASDRSAAAFGTGDGPCPC